MAQEEGTSSVRMRSIRRSSVLVGPSQISLKFGSVQGSALHLAFEAASLIEKETFVLKFHTRVECWRFEVGGKK